MQASCSEENKSDDCSLPSSLPSSPLPFTLPLSPFVGLSSLSFKCLNLVCLVIRAAGSCDRVLGITAYSPPDLSPLTRSRALFVSSNSASSGELPSPLPPLLPPLPPAPLEPLAARPLLGSSLMSLDASDWLSSSADRGLIPFTFGLEDVLVRRNRGCVRSKPDAGRACGCSGGEARCKGYGAEVRLCCRW